MAQTNYLCHKKYSTLHIPLMNRGLGSGGGAESIHNIKLCVQNTGNVFF